MHVGYTDEQSSQLAVAQRLMNGMCVLVLRDLDHHDPDPLTRPSCSMLDMGLCVQLPTGG